MAARDKAAGALPADPHHPAPDGSTPVQDGTETGTEAGVAAEIGTRPDDAVPGGRSTGRVCRRPRITRATSSSRPCGTTARTTRPMRRSSCPPPTPRCCSPSARSGSAEP